MGRTAEIPHRRTICRAGLEADRVGAAELATHLVIGMAPDGGTARRRHARRVVLAAIDAGLDIDSGLHDLSGGRPGDQRVSRVQRPEFSLRDVRRPPPGRDEPALLQRQDRRGRLARHRRSGDRFCGRQAHDGRTARRGPRRGRAYGRGHRHRTDGMVAGCALRHRPGLARQRLRCRRAGARSLVRLEGPPARCSPGRRPGQSDAPGLPGRFRDSRRHSTAWRDPAARPRP